MRASCRFAAHRGFVRAPTHRSKSSSPRRWNISPRHATTPARMSAGPPLGRGPVAPAPRARVPGGPPRRDAGSARGFGFGFGDGFAHAQHAGGVHPTMLGLLACSGRLRRLLLDDHGAVLHLGRAVRLATSAQKRALYGRDIGCVIPGCGVPGDLCEVHHVVPWLDGGSTDIDNLVLACPRHHVEVTDGTWEIEMIDGVPWARPPGWVHPGRPLLRNASHRTTAA